MRTRQKKERIVNTVLPHCDCCCGCGRICICATGWSLCSKGFSRLLYGLRVSLFRFASVAHRDIPALAPKQMKERKCKEEYYVSLRAARAISSREKFEVHRRWIRSQFEFGWNRLVFLRSFTRRSETIETNIHTSFSAHTIQANRERKTEGIDNFSNRKSLMCLSLGCLGTHVNHKSVTKKCT